jgi:prepilin-type N-terminal cleavage/methylation domain-containing protein
MLTRINKRLRQQEGFTLMELMIVVVILGILMAIAIPVYQGVQDRARQKVGEANATMLNRGVRTLEALGDLDDEGEPFAFAYPADWEELTKFLDLEGDDDVKYVKWYGDESKFVWEGAEVDGELTLVPPETTSEETP